MKIIQLLSTRKGSWNRSDTTKLNRIISLWSVAQFGKHFMLFFFFMKCSFRLPIHYLFLVIKPRLPRHSRSKYHI